MKDTLKRLFNKSKNRVGKVMTWFLALPTPLYRQMEVKKLGNGNASIYKDIILLTHYLTYPPIFN
jgi:hypothetical protein